MVVMRYTFVVCRVLGVQAGVTDQFQCCGRCEDARWMDVAMATTQ